MTDLRCPSKKHGELVEPSIVEIKCNSRFCGAQDGAVVLHRFDAGTGDLIDTRIFKEPRKESPHGHSIAVRAS